MLLSHLFFFFFFNDTATTEIYTLSLHDALPIWLAHALAGLARAAKRREHVGQRVPASAGDRKSTRLNSSHVRISYAVFCLKKKKKVRPDGNSSSTGTAIYRYNVSGHVVASKDSI